MQEEKEETGQNSNGGTSVVVLTYNSGATIEQCLSSVASQLGEGDELIVVDNASVDDSVERASALCSAVQGLRVIRNDQNLGFSAGANVGLRVASRDFLLLLNPDTVLRVGCIERLKERLVDPEVAAVGPVSNYAAGLQNIGNYLRIDRPFSHDELHALVSRQMAGQAVKTKLLIGFCMMFRRSVLEEVGYLDEDLFLGSDDLEISWRLRVNGYKLLIAPDVYVEHKGGVSFASEPGEKIRLLLNDSTRVLREKLRRFYSPAPVPRSRVLWGCDIFPE